MGTIINPLGGYLSINSTAVGVGNGINMYGNTIIYGSMTINGNCDSNYSSFTNAILNKSNIITANIISGTINYADLGNIYSSKSNITLANITMANITLANITLANITTANITTANIITANIRTANITTTTTNATNATYIYQNSYLMIPPGVIFLWGGTTCPSGWLLCNGNSYTTTDYTNLYSIIGYTFGGSSLSGKFNVPNFTSNIPIGVSSSTYVLSNSSGNTSVILSTSQLPAHSHTITVSDPGHTHSLSVPSHTHSTSDPGHTHSVSGSTTYFSPFGNDQLYANDSFRDIWTSLTSTAIPFSGTAQDATPSMSIQSATTGISLVSTTTGITATSSQTGSGSSINIRNPYISIYYIIKT